MASASQFAIHAVIALLVVRAVAENSEKCLEKFESCQLPSGRVMKKKILKETSLLQHSLVKMQSVQAHQQKVEAGCHTATDGEPCFEGTMWAMQTGISSNPEWYDGLTASSTFEEFQKVLHAGGHSGCAMPCEACHTAKPGELCHAGVTWAKQAGINSNPDWYDGLNSDSSFEEFQQVLHAGEHSECPMPCAEDETMPIESATPANPEPVARVDPAQPVPSDPSMPSLPGWHPISNFVGNPSKPWCTVGKPDPTWVLKQCDGAGDLQVKILSYNLFWWNLFGRRGGNGGSAGKLIRRNFDEDAYDFMALQEADDVRRVLRDAGLDREYGFLAGSGMGLAYRKSQWRVVSKGLQAVTEDRPEQYYGLRNVQWGRAVHRKTGRGVFFANHHGGLPLHTGGICGGEATAYKMLEVIAENAHSGDAIIFTGDFNAGVHTSEIKTLDKHIHRIFTGTAIGGIDHIYSNCGGSKVASARKLGTGGSDHDAIEAVFNI